LFIGATFTAMENHRTDSIPNDSYPVKSDRLLGQVIVESAIMLASTTWRTRIIPIIRSQTKEIGAAR